MSDPELGRALARIGPLWASDIRRHSQEVKDLYDPLLAAAPKDGVTVHRDLAYGPHERHRLDVFQPRGQAQAPVVVFVHGGAFVRGDKRTTAELYDNVLFWFARQGCLGLNLEYRLAPEATYPAGALDVAAAVRWATARAARFGGDPSRVFLVGHSAGGTHVATYACDPAGGGVHDSVRGVVLISARLQADVLSVNPNREGVAAYFGSDAEVHERASPLHHAHRLRLPTLVVTAEFENPLLDLYGAQFAARLRDSGHPQVEHLHMQGHNHMSIVAHFNTEEDALGRRILGFLGLGSVTAARSP